MALKQRRIVRKLTDLLPEVLIEAQGCDEITATAAIRRAVETLCQSNGFCVSTFWMCVGECDLGADVDALMVHLPVEKLLRVYAVELKTESGFRRLSHWSVDGGFLMIKRGELPEVLEQNGHRTCLRVTAEFMPEVDADVEQFEAFTKWRHLVIAKTLEDLFSMTGQPWANSTRFQLYAERARRFLEDYLVVEKHFRGDARSRSAAQASSFENVFC